MRAYELLEYNQASLLATFKDKFITKWKREGKPFADEIGSEGENLLQWIEQYDPTQNKKYMTWLVGKYAGKKEGIKRLEDIPSRAFDLLDTYDRLSRKKKLKPEHNNINQIKSLSDLWEILQTYKEEDTTSQQEKVDEIEQEMYDEDDAELIHDDKEYKVIIAKTHKASCYFGKNTQWCTTSSSSSGAHDQHSEQGPLYIILEKSTNTRWQFHFESSQFMDENDSSIDLQMFFDEHPVIFELFEGLDIDYMKIYKLEEIVEKEGFTKEVADILDTVLQQNNIRTNTLEVYKESTDKANPIIVIHEWSDFGNFINDMYDEILIKLYDIHEDGLSEDEYDFEIDDNDYIDLINMLDDYHQKKLFAVSGTTNAEKTLWMLQRENHKYFQQLESALTEAYKTSEKLREVVKERIFKYLDIGIYFVSNYTYTNLSNISEKELDLDKPVYLLIFLDDLINHARAGEYDEDGDYDNYKIKEYGWATSESVDYNDYQKERRQEEGLIDKEGKDKFLQTVTTEPNLNVAYDSFRKMFVENEELDDALMLEKMVRLANIK